MSSETLASSLATSEAQTPYRELPYNLEAEQIVLGALLVRNDKLNDISDFLESRHFFEPVHGRIYEAIIRSMDKGLIANPVTLKHYFDKDEALKELGGAQYLARLAAMAGLSAHVLDYAKAVHDLALRRELVALGDKMILTATDAGPDEPATAQIEAAEQSLFSLATSGSVERNTISIADALQESLRRAEMAFQNRGKVIGVTTGFTDLDRLMGGFQNSDLIILAGRPSMGKTALATTMAFKAAEALLEKFKAGHEIANKPGSVAIFSLEMSAEQLATRLLASVTGVNSNKMRRGDLNNEEFAELVRGTQKMSEWKLFIDDTPAISVSALRTRARRLKRMHNLSFLVVDYLQLMRGTSAAAQANRVQEISEITQGLKAIAKELDIPVIALSQLSRAVEQREDKRPQLADLRESGSIEQDADVVMFVFREEYYLARTMPREDSPKFTEWQQEMERVHGTAEVIVAKQRHGPIGIEKLAFHGDTTRFSDLQREDYVPIEMYE